MLNIFKRNFVPSPSEIQEAMSYRITDMMEIFKYYQLKDSYIKYLNTGTDPKLLEEYYRKMRGIGLFNADIFTGNVPAWATNGFKFSVSVPEEKKEPEKMEPLSLVPDHCPNNDTSDLVEIHDPISVIEDHKSNPDCDDVENKEETEDSLNYEYYNTTLEQTDNDYDSFEEDEAVSILFNHGPIEHIDNIFHCTEVFQLDNQLSNDALILCDKIMKLSHIMPSHHVEGDVYYTINVVAELMNVKAIDFGRGIVLEHITEDVKPYVPHSPIIYSLRYDGELYQTFRFSDGTTFAFRENKIIKLPFITDFYVTYYNGEWRNFRDQNYQCCGRNIIYLHSNGMWSSSYRCLTYEYKPISCITFPDIVKLFVTIVKHSRQHIFNYDTFISDVKFDHHEVFLFRQIMYLFGIFYTDYTYYYYNLALPVGCERKIYEISRSFRQIVNKSHIICTPSRSIVRFDSNKHFHSRIFRPSSNLDAPHQKRLDVRRRRRRRKKKILTAASTQHGWRFDKHVYCSPNMKEENNGAASSLNPRKNKRIEKNIEDCGRKNVPIENKRKNCKWKRANRKK
jgi:hypothetical protein